MRNLIFFLLTFSALCSAADDPSALFQQARQILETQDNGDLNKAISLLKRATSQWQESSSKAPEYVSALDYLAVSLMVQLRENAGGQEESRLADFGEWIKRAKPYTKRALDICEANPAIDPSVLALALELEAQIEGQQGSGAALWDRAAKIRAQRVAALNTGDLILGPIIQPDEEHTTGPRAISIAKPNYTAIAQLAQYRGLVALKAVAGVDGRAHQVELVRGLGFGLDEEGAQALLRSRFTPGTKDNQPVAAVIKVEVEFRLE